MGDNGLDKYSEGISAASCFGGRTSDINIDNFSTYSDEDDKHDPKLQTPDPRC